MADMLKDRLDWERIMLQPRNSGGHEEVMKVLFKDAEVIACYIEDNYQGAEGFAYRLKDTGEIVVVSDVFGSCSVCDSWEGATDEEARRLCIELANNAHVFASIQDAIKFLESVPEDEGAYWDLREVAPFLTEELKKQIRGGDAMQISRQTTSFHLERSHDEQCKSRQEVIMALHEAIAWVEGHMGADQTADVYVSIYIPHSRWAPD